MCVTIYTHAITHRKTNFEKAKYERVNTHLCSYSILILCSEKKERKKETKIFRVCFAYLLTTEKEKKPRE